MKASSSSFGELVENVEELMEELAVVPSLELFTSIAKLVVITACAVKLIPLMFAPATVTVCDDGVKSKPFLLGVIV
jgi:hypothetical protein